MKTKNELYKRNSKEKIMEAHKELEKEEILEKILNSIPNIVLVLNENRQLIYTNNLLLESLNIENDKKILGKRPGEIFNCIHAFETEGGCGTTEFCKYCGAYKAITSSLNNVLSIEDCRIMTKKDDKLSALDLQVKASPLKIDGKRFVIFAIRDIADEKRRLALEKTFFHDVLDTAAAIKNSIDIINTADNFDQYKEILKMLPPITDKLLDEIKGQRELILVEHGNYELDPGIINTQKELKAIINQYRNYLIAENKKIKLEKNTEEFEIITDGTLLSRVLGNMVKNALEAIDNEETVTLGAHKTKKGDVKFWVHNPGAIPKDIQMQLFQRSFSTKGKNRGIGTYSIKLLTENYLKGTASFTSNKNKGTTFFITIPTNLNEN